MKDCREWLIDVDEKIKRVNNVFPLGSVSEINMFVYNTTSDYHSSPIGDSARNILNSKTLPPWFLGNTNSMGFHIVHRNGCDSNIPVGFIDETLVHEYCHACTHSEFPFTLDSDFDKWYVESIAVYLSGRISNNVYREDCPSYRELSSGMKY